MSKGKEALKGNRNFFSSRKDEDVSGSRDRMSSRLRVVSLDSSVVIRTSVC